MNMLQTGNLGTALKALKDEEAEIVNQIKGLQIRLDDLRAAIVPLDKLVSAQSPAQQGLFQSNSRLKTSAPPTVLGTSYKDMSVREAVIHFMHRFQSPISTSELTKRLLDDGYENSGVNFDKIVYMVLRRGLGKEFDRNPNSKRWTLRETD